MIFKIAIFMALIIVLSGCLELFGEPLNQVTNAFKLGPGGCIDGTSCREYCDKNLQECISWCGENEHVLCGEIGRDYLGDNFGNISIDDIFNTEDFFGSIGIGSGESSFDCDATTLERVFESEPYYKGEFIDTHVHMPLLIDIPGINDLLPFNDIPVLGKDVSGDEIVCLMNKSNIKQAIGFYALTEELAGPATFIINGVEKNHPGKIIAFIQPAPFSSPLFKPTTLDGLLAANRGVYSGYGELATYFDIFEGTSPNDPNFLETYEVAEKHNQIIMLHPTPENLGDLENAIEQFPNVTFLLHGGEVKNFITPLLESHDNVFFDIDSGLATDYLFNTFSKENFLETLKENFDEDLKKDVTFWKPKIEANPDKFVWGTDKLERWHFDEQVDALLIEYSRSFIGQLDPSVQEKIAYKNAERILQK